ncbi:unnamed protein product, partial [marine sediment metagenome]
GRTTLSMMRNIYLGSSAGGVATIHFVACPN